MSSGRDGKTRFAEGDGAAEGRTDAVSGGEGEGVPPAARTFLAINVAFFAILLFADLAPHPGRFVALCAAAILSWNGGWFLFAAWSGGFPGDAGMRFGRTGRTVLTALGVIMAACGLLAVLSVALPPQVATTPKGVVTP